MSWHHEKLICLWLTEPLPTCLGHIMTTHVSTSILALAPFLLQEFLRKGRTLSEVDRWKTTEFWTFLLYTGCIILKSALEKLVYRNFLCLMVAVTILAAENLCVNFCNYADRLLKLLAHWKDLWRETHTFSDAHWAQAKQYGPLHSFASSLFENYLQTLKRHICKPSLPIQQVIRHIKERRPMPSDQRSGDAKCLKPHSRGPVPRWLSGGCKQFEKNDRPSYVLSVDCLDNAIIVEDSTYLLRNIVLKYNMKYRICNKFIEKEPYFTESLDSTIIGITLVSRPSSQLLVIHPTHEAAKSVLLPVKTIQELSRIFHRYFAIIHVLYIDEFCFISSFHLSYILSTLYCHIP